MVETIEEVQSLNWQPMGRYLPSVPGTIVDDWNAILTACSTALLLKLVDGTQYTCRLKPLLEIDAQPDFQPEMIVKIRSGRYQMQIGLQYLQAFPMLHGSNAALLPEEIKYAIVEGYFENMLNHLEQFGGPVSVAEIIFNPVEMTPFNCLLSWQLVAEPGGVASKACLGTDPSGLKWLAANFAAINRDTEDAWIDRIRLPSAIRLATMALKPSQIAQLEVLDIVMIQTSQTEISDWAISVYIAGSVYCCAKLNFDKSLITITEIVRQDMQNDKADQEPESKAQETSEAETDLDMQTRLDELDVEMIFEIGRRHFRLRALKQMTPGYVVNLSNAIKEPVQVYVGGRHFATGQIVQVDGCIGVRLLKIVHKRDTYV